MISAIRACLTVRCTVVELGQRWRLFVWFRVYPLLFSHIRSREHNQHVSCCLVALLTDMVSIVAKCAKRICCDVSFFLFFFFTAGNVLVCINSVFGNPAFSFCACNLANLAWPGLGFGDSKTVNIIWGSKYFGTFLSTIFFVSHSTDR